MGSEAHNTEAAGLLDELLSSPGLLLAMLGQAALRRLRAVHTDLTPRQFHLLAVLHDEGATGQRELGQSMGIDPSILVTLLNPLEADGYVTRQRDPTDRRRHIVSLTASGERHLDRAAQAQREAEKALFAGLSATQLEQLRRALLSLRDTTAIADHDACAPPESPPA
jgi:DNA-binding MarR family transcriptional regulator